MKKYNWPLMSNNITKADKKALIKCINETDKFTNGINVKKFEDKWSKWLGVKYSTFVNSGASANFLSLNILKEIKQNKSEVILPAFTWNSDVVAVINSGFKPIFVDISLKNLVLSLYSLLNFTISSTIRLLVTSSGKLKSGFINQLFLFIFLF